VLRSLLDVIRSMVCIPRVLLLDLRMIDVDLPHNEHVDLVSSLLRAAADLSPVELSFSITPTPSYTLNVALPCFLHTTSIELHGLDLLFSELSANRYMFPKLETLPLRVQHMRHGRFDSPLPAPARVQDDPTHCFRYSCFGATSHPY
jgi:hypothetical protein